MKYLHNLLKLYAGKWQSEESNELDLSGLKSYILSYYNTS